MSGRTKPSRRRRVIVPVPPRGLRPKLKADQVRDLALCHVVNLDAIAHGDADEATLWQWVGGILTWSRVASLLDTGVAEMNRQLDLVTAVGERYGRTGRAVFTGPEYQLAKEGVDVMDALSLIVDRATAIAAAEWSEQQATEFAARVKQARAAARVTEEA